MHTVDLADELQALALRAEQRFEHQRVTGGALAHRDALGVRQRFGGPGGRRADARRMQQQAGHRFVDAAFDRTRVVVDRHAEFAQGMQHAEPLGDLLEATARDAAHQHRVGQGAAEAGNDQAVPGRRGVDVAVRQIDAAANAAACPQGRLQLARVPAGLVGHDGHGQTRHHASCSHRSVSSGMFSAPACQVLPLSRLLTQTSAGANRAPSIL